MAHVRVRRSISSRNTSHSCYCVSQHLGLLRKLDEDNKAALKSADGQYDAMQLMYDEQINQIMQENQQLIEEKSALQAKNMTLQERFSDLHLFSMVNHLEGDVESLSKRMPEFQTSTEMVKIFRDLRSEVSKGSLSCRQAWEKLASSYDNCCTKQADRAKPLLLQVTQLFMRCDWPLSVLHVFQLVWPAQQSCLIAFMASFRMRITEMKRC